jgi:hypothetical protein
MKWLFDMILLACKNRFTGSITINFFQGGITNINKNESIKPPTEAQLAYS